MKKKVKKIVYYVLKLYEYTIGKLLYTSAKRYASIHTKLMHYTDWYFGNKEPSSYKHEINLYNWMYEPSQVEFAEGGVFGRMLIHENNTVLDLCCGDGSYDYLFFSDIAGQIDAVDYDANSINYAKSAYKHKNINYICSDLLLFEYKDDFYDVVTWRAGAAYFAKKDRKTLFQFICKSLKKEGKFYIGTPLMKEENFSANQIEVITSELDFKKEFEDLFNISFEQKTFYKNKTNVNYVLSKK